MHTRLLAVLLAMLSGLAPALAQPSGDAAAREEEQRARIQAERTRIEQQFSTDLADCQRRFVVTPCVDEARQRRRDALSRPRAEGMTLDDLERRERAVARREAVQAKQREAAARAAPAVPASAAVTRVRPAAANPAASRSAAGPAQTQQEAQDEAARRVQAARERQAEIEATQARIRARQAEKLREGKVVAPLPVPAASR